MLQRGSSVFLAKEDPDIDASLEFDQGNRHVIITSAFTSQSDPTLSARCDGSQLLLGILLIHEEVTNREIPTAIPFPVSFRIWFRRYRSGLTDWNSRDIPISASVNID
jgi:hypothetical protein